MLTLYVEEEKKNLCAKVCREAGYAPETGLKVMVQRMLNEPELMRCLLQPEGWNSCGAEEISADALADQLRSGGLPGGAVAVRDSSGTPYVLLAAARYEGLLERLNNREEKLVIRKTKSPGE